MTERLNLSLVDLPAQHGPLADDLCRAFRKIVDSGAFILGEHGRAFEREFAAHCGVEHAVGCASGTDALLLCLMALGVEPGDEVVCPSFSFIGTATPIVRLGATPIFADIDSATHTIDVEHVRRLLERPRVRCVMPVHLFGRIANMDGLLAAARERELPVIEDAAQAAGARDASGAHAGSRGLAGCFSFFPTKNLGGLGDGGIVTTSDEAFAQRLRLLRNHGIAARHEHAEVGLNSRLDEMQAAALRLKLPLLEAWNAARNVNADAYDRAFAEAGALPADADMEEADLPLLYPRRPERPAIHALHHYVVRVPGDARGSLREQLAAQGVGTDAYYEKPIHQQPCMAPWSAEQNPLPETERAAREALALPVHPGAAPEQCERVAGIVIEFLRDWSAAHRRAEAGRAPSIVVPAAGASARAAAQR